jgi:hypothetical protein
MAYINWPKTAGAMDMLNKLFFFLTPLYSSVWNTLTPIFAPFPSWNLLDPANASLPLGDQQRRIRELVIAHMAAITPEQVIPLSREIDPRLAFIEK